MRSKTMRIEFLTDREFLSHIDFFFKQCYLYLKNYNALMDVICALTILSKISNISQLLIDRHYIINNHPDVLPLLSQEILKRKSDMNAAKCAIALYAYSIFKDKIFNIGEIHEIEEIYTKAYVTKMEKPSTLVYALLGSCEIKPSDRNFLQYILSRIKREIRNMNTDELGGLCLALARGNILHDKIFLILKNKLMDIKVNEIRIMKASAFTNLMYGLSKLYKCSELNRKLYHEYLLWLRLKDIKRDLLPSEIVKLTIGLSIMHCWNNDIIKILQDEIIRCSGYYRKKDVEHLKKAFINMEIIKSDSFYSKLHIKLRDREAYFSDDEGIEFKLNDLSI